MEYARDRLIRSLGLDSVRTRKEERLMTENIYFSKKFLLRSVLFSTHFCSKRLPIYRRIPPKTAEFRLY